MDDKIKVQYTVNSKILFQYMLKLQHHILHIFTWRKGGWKEKRNLQWNKLFMFLRAQAKRILYCIIYIPEWYNFLAIAILRQNSMILNCCHKPV